MDIPWYRYESKEFFSMPYINQNFKVITFFCRQSQKDRDQKDITVFYIMNQSTLRPSPMELIIRVVQQHPKPPSKLAVSCYISMSWSWNYPRNRLSKNAILHRSIMAGAASSKIKRVYPIVTKDLHKIHLWQEWPKAA